MEQNSCYLDPSMLLLMEWGGGFVALSVTISRECKNQYPVSLLPMGFEMGYSSSINAKTKQTSKQIKAEQHFLHS